MTRPLPLHVTLGLLTYTSREARAAEVLAPEAVRNAASAAAREGRREVLIPLGPVSFEGTAAARELAAVKGLTLEWVEGVTRDGAPLWQLRLMWEPLPPKDGHDRP